MGHLNKFFLSPFLLFVNDILKNCPLSITLKFLSPILWVSDWVCTMTQLGGKRTWVSWISPEIHGFLNVHISDDTVQDKQPTVAASRCNAELTSYVDA